MGLRERDRELTDLGGRLREAATGRGQLIDVEGVAGSGKTALLGELSRVGADEGLQVLSARGGELERSLAFGVIRQLFEATLAAASARERERLLGGSAALAAGVIAVGPEAATAAAASGFEVLHAIYWLTAGLAARAPLLVIVDDLHWADHSSLLALSYLAGRIADLPVAIVAASRPHEPGTDAELIDGVRAGASTTMALRPLSAAAVAAVVHEQIADADAAVCEACVEMTAGNPLYLRDLLRAVDAGDGTAPTPELVRRAGIAGVGDRALRRIARIGPGARSLAQAMSVLGAGALTDAARVAELDAATAAAVGRDLVRMGVLSSEEPFEFVHPLVRTSVYGSLTVSERGAAHLAAARALHGRGAGIELVGANLELVAPSGAGDVAELLVAAADDAIARGARFDAARLLRRALAEDAAAPARAGILHRLGQVAALERDPAAIAALAAAYASADDAGERARIVLDLSAILAFTGNWSESVRVIEEALAELADDDPALRLRLEAVRAATTVYDPRLIETFDRDRERLHALARSDTWGSRALAAVLAAEAATRRGDRAAVVELAAHAVEDDALLLEPGAAGWALSQCMFALLIVDEWELLGSLSDRLLTLARAAGRSDLIGVGYQACLHARAGDLLGAETILAPAWEGAREMDAVTVLFFVTDLLCERETLPMLAELPETMELPPDFSTTTSGAMLLETRGRLRAARGERTAAAADFRDAGAIFSRLGVGPAMSQWRSSLALAMDPPGGEEASDLVARELASAAATGLARPIGIARRAEGLLAGRDGIEPLRASVDALAGSGSDLELARSLLALGLALHRRGDAVDAREPLAAARELAHRAGAPTTFARATDGLRASGGRPRRIARSGAEALTPSERRTAGLAADGCSNVEIAQQLVVSVKTVEAHLSRTYEKLGLRRGGARRDRLAAALAVDGADSPGTAGRT